MSKEQWEQLRKLCDVIEAAGTPPEDNSGLYRPVLNAQAQQDELARVFVVLEGYDGTGGCVVSAVCVSQGRANRAAKEIATGEGWTYSEAAMMWECGPHWVKVEVRPLLR
jgi:hypothetical protein